MRFLAIHAEYFRCEITEKRRSPIVEACDTPVTEENNVVVILVSVEKSDENHEVNISGKASREILTHCNNLKVNNIILHPFAHLFGDLSKPKTAVKTLKLLETELINAGFNVKRTPFGWFNTFELKAKGHPLSRVARIITC